MKCPECVKANKPSKVYVIYNSLNVSAIFSANFSKETEHYFDENDMLHTHNPNPTPITYHCSNGHTWTTNEPKTCWCGWPNGIKKDKFSEQLKNIINYYLEQCNTSFACDDIGRIRHVLEFSEESKQILRALMSELHNNTNTKK